MQSPKYRRIHQDRWVEQRVFLPGRVKAAWDVELAAAALAAEAAAEEEDPSELLAFEDAAVAEDDPVAEAEPEAVGVAMVLTVDNPLTEAAGVTVPDAAVDVAFAEVADAEVLLDMDMEPELMDDPEMLLDIWVTEEASALIVDEEK